jgi:tyrosinase
MHAHTTLALSLSATLAYALPASNCSTSTVNTTTTVRAYVLPQHTEAASIAPKQEHVDDLRSQISSLKQQLSSQREASATLCHAPAETTAAPGGKKGNNGGAPCNPSATHEAANWSYFKTAQQSRLPATSTIAYTDCTSSPGVSQQYTGASKPSDYNNKPASSAQATEVPFSYSAYKNGTASHYGTSSSSQISGGLSTGLISSSTSKTSLSPTYIPKLEDYSIAEIESGEALEDANKVAIQRLQERNDLNGSCTFESARVRTEFRKMSNEDRKGFTNAISCLKQTPTSVDATAYPGVKSRYDEFVATHINMTMSIHVTADMLAWHRNYIWEFENDLINTCGYTGSLPYWDWARDAYAPHDSEVFNGDEFSLGSDGAYIEGRDDTYLGLMDVTFPPGTGGGCVHSGPFSGGNFSNLGPLDSPYGDNVENDYDFNPRCLVRDLNVYFSSRYNTYANVTQLLLGQTDIQYFQAEMQGFVGDNKLGIHGAGHWLGGGPSQMQDFHSSPNDPVFFLHHAMIDRVWSIWQALDSKTRQDSIYGTSTLNNSPPSPEMSLTDSLAFGFAGQNEIFGDLMDTLGGKFCYRYE